MTNPTPANQDAAGPAYAVTAADITALTLRTTREAWLGAARALRLHGWPDAAELLEKAASPRLAPVAGDPR